MAVSPWNWQGKKKGQNMTYVKKDMHMQQKCAVLIVILFQFKSLRILSSLNIIRNHSWKFYNTPDSYYGSPTTAMGFMYVHIILICEYRFGLVLRTEDREKLFLDLDLLQFD